MAIPYRVRITKQAQSQLKGIVIYIAEELCAPGAAANLIGKFEKATGSLMFFPERNALVDEEPWRSQGIRKITVNNFLMYYRVDTEGQEVQVIAIVFSKRDQMNQLSSIETDANMLNEEMPTIPYGKSRNGS